MEKGNLISVDRSKLKDIKDVTIDIRKPCRERIKDFISQVGNPIVIWIMG